MKKEGQIINKSFLWCEFVKSFGRPLHGPFIRENGLDYLTSVLFGLNQLAVFN